MLLRCLDASRHLCNSRQSVGSADFFAIDLYTTQYITAPPEGISACVSDPNNPLWPSCVQSMEFDVNGWAIGPSADPVGSPWLISSPQFLRQTLKDIYKRWPSKEMVLSSGCLRPWLTTHRTTLDHSRIWIRRTVRKL